MRELALPEIQKVELDILSTIADICERENLRYFLQYGTLLGAIRHKGFIPWDDDLDICMPRYDYEKLLQYFRDHKEELQPLELEHYTTNKKYIFPIARISNSDYCVDYEGKRDYGLGVFVDIYPFDGCGNSREEVQKIFEGSRNMISIISSGGRTKFERSPFGIKRNIIKFVIYCYTSIFGMSRLIEKLDKKSQSMKFEKYKYVYQTVWWMSPRCVQERSDFDDYIYVDFCGYKFRTFKDYDKVLRLNYGDYMQLPPEEKRVGHHYYKAYKKY